MINPTFKRYPVGATAAHALVVALPTPIDDREGPSVSRKVAGSIGALVYAMFKTVPGAVQGLVQGARFKGSDGPVPARASTGLYTVTAVAETMAAGAGVGAVGGPLGMAIGTGAGFLVAVLRSMAENHHQTAEFISTIDHRVETYLTFNGDAARPVLHKAMEGGKVGAQLAWRQGLDQGWDAGVGLIDNLQDAIFGK